MTEFLRTDIEINSNQLKMKRAGGGSLSLQGVGASHPQMVVSGVSPKQAAGMTLAVRGS